MNEQVPDVLDDERTPPEIVASADSPAEALAAFIAQELENWGFQIRPGRDRTFSADGIFVITVKP